MTWLRVDDGFDNDPRLLAVARTRAEVDRLLGMMVALMLYAARHLTDGWLPALIVAEHIPPAMLPRLVRAGLLHPAGEACECLRGRAWPPDAAYALHHYLKMNPSKAEHDINRRKAAELRDRELLVAVRARDGDACRYCGETVNGYDRRSGHGLVYDHVDPRIACGAANLVICCRGCNSRKGKRTPEAAGMVLLAVPGTDPAPISGSGADAPTRARPDGTGRTSARDDPTAPDPYLRTAITGLDPAHHAGLPAEEDYPPPPGGL